MIGKRTGIATLTGIGFVAFGSVALADMGNHFIVNSWTQDSDSNKCHFDKNGIIQTAWYQDINGKYDWLDRIGRINYDKICTIQEEYSLDGVLYDTWQEHSSGWWYLKENRVFSPVNAWKQIGNAWYHFDENGYMQTGWYTENVDTGELKYYLKESGARACNEILQLDEENLYYFDENGIFTGTTPVKTEAELELERLANQIVMQLITKDTTEREKATAIYKWIQSHIGYIATSDKSDWVAEAIRGLQTRRGDCFTYFAVARAMLDAAGIENMPVYPKEGYHVHYWNLVYIEGGWYHFDTTPRKSGATFCIVTNAQYDALSGARYSTRYLENGMEYPSMATE